MDCVVLRTYLASAFSIVISRDPDDPDNKTRLAVLAHADPGGIPQWVCFGKMMR
jgi:hypothetical protein